MSITATPGQTFEATVNNAATGLVGTITIRIEDGQNGIITAPTTAGIVETAIGVYTATMTAPVPIGQYVVVWSRGSGAEVGEDLTVSVTGAAPSGVDLTTLAAVRAEQQKPSSNTDQDAIIATLITQASRAIIGYCDREFAPHVTNVTRVFELNRHDEGWLQLAPYDLAALTTIAIDTDSPTPVTLTTAEYRLYPKNTPDGTYQAIRLAPFALVAPSIRFAFREVSVTGDWGFPTIPVDVERACIVTVNEWLRDRWLRDPGMTSELAQAGMPEPARPSALPYAARSLLSNYKVYGSA